jgi:hypothetical protein
MNVIYSLASTSTLGKLTFREEFSIENLTAVVMK